MLKSAFRCNSCLMHMHISLLATNTYNTAQIHNCFLRLARPNSIRNAPHKHQLLPHILIPQRIPLSMARKAALRAHTNALQRLFVGLIIAFSNEVSSLVDTGNHFVLVLEGGELGGNYTEHDVLVLGKMC